MPVNRVLRPVVEVKEELSSVTCNVCGKTEACPNYGGIPADFHVIELTGGYGSEFPADMDKFEIVVCEDCLRAWVKTFKHPEVNIGCGMNPIPTKALHTETGKTMYVHKYLATEGAEFPAEAYHAEFDHSEDYPRPKTVWKHFKGSLYQIRGIVWEWPSGVPLVHYQGLYGESLCFLRPLSMFMDEARVGVPRFEFLTL